MLYTLLCVLIVAILAAGSYYAAHHIATLRLNHKTLTDEHNRAVEYIQQLEDDIKQLVFERDQGQSQTAEETQRSGWENFR